MRICQPEIKLGKLTFQKVLDSKDPIDVTGYEHVLNPYFKMKITFHYHETVQYMVFEFQRGATDPEVLPSYPTREMLIHLQYSLNKGGIDFKNLKEKFKLFQAEVDRIFEQKIKESELETFVWRQSKLKLNRTS